MPTLKAKIGGVWVPVGAAGGAGLAGWPFGELTPLDQAAWSWVNQGGASVAQTDELVSLHSPSAGGTNLVMRVVTAPTPPYTIELGLVPNYAVAGSVSNLNALGFVWRESGTGKVVAATYANFKASTGGPPPAFWAANYNSPTSFGALIGTETVMFSGFVLPFGVAWLRLADTGVNLVSEWSFDRITWTAIATVGRTAHLAGGPDQIGVVVSHQAGSGSRGGWIIHWLES